VNAAVIVDPAELVDRVLKPGVPTTVLPAIE
jgi:hypothetical protein